MQTERRRATLDLDLMCTLERDRLRALDRDIWRVFLRLDLGRLVSLFSFFWWVASFGCDASFAICLRWDGRLLWLVASLDMGRYPFLVSLSAALCGGLRWRHFMRSHGGGADVHNARRNFGVFGKLGIFAAPIVFWKLR